MRVRIELSPLAAKHQSGVAQYTRLLAEALADHTEVNATYGHYFDFLGRQPKPKLKRRLTKLEPNRFIPLRVYAKLQSYGVAPAFDIVPPRKAVDLTIFTNFATWPTLRTKKRATVVHDLTYMYFPEATDEKNLAHLKRVVPRTIKKADFVITVSETVKQELIKEFGLQPEKCVATPIPPDEQFYNPVPESVIVVAKKKYNITKKYIYFIGNLEPRKNLSALIRAYSALPQKVKDEYSLVLAGGKGWKTEETEKTLREAQDDGDDIRHIGFIDHEDTPALYHGASLFVMPSLYEGFGIPVLEAMASGCPVVAADIPVLREVGANVASYANTEDSVQFARAIEESLAKKHSKDDLQQNARRYSWTDNITKILAAYQD